MERYSSFLYNDDMMVIDKLKNNPVLSANEQTAADYLYSYEGDLSPLSASQIAQQTFVSPSTIIRLAKKLGYEGWTQLKEAICTERTYLQKEVKEVDANFPFTPSSTIQQITARLEKLQTDTIHSTAELIHHDELQKAAEDLYHAKRIYIFGMANASAMAQDFAYKMRFLFKDVRILNNRDDFACTWQMIEKNDCCIFLSVSGQTFEDLNMTGILQKRICPCISITAYKDNILLKCTDVHFYIPDQEDRYAKIGHFVSSEAIHFILDVLYACTFNRSYGESIDNRRMYIQAVDQPLQNKKP